MIKTIDPSSGLLITEYNYYSSKRVFSIIDDVHSSSLEWREENLASRIECISRLGNSLEKNREELATLVTKEMGKLYSESLLEIDKSISLCSYLSHIAADGINLNNRVNLSNLEVSCSPIGIVFGIMPWNFPVWQVMRYALPSLAIGNGVLLKHAPNVTGVSLYLENLFERCGFNKNIFRSLIIPVDMVYDIIAYDKVQAVSFTGSDKVGSLIASTAGKYIKKTVLELGGSDPFIILSDADLDVAFKAAFDARMQNMGQSCIAGKRFIVEEKIYDAFIEYISDRISRIEFGSLFDSKTSIAPLSTDSALDRINSQVQVSLSGGASVISPLKDIDSNGFYYTPKIITGADRSMPALSQELFGPVFSVVSTSKDGIVRLANDTEYGLGASLWTNDKELANSISHRIDSGMVFINEITRSSPEIPFGGIKKSGYGRELSALGLYEFANIKSIYSSYSK